MSQSKRDITLLSTADWDNPFWTNKQHVAVELANQGNRVLYIDSLGLRAPSVNSSDIRRIVKRLVKAIRGPKQVKKNIWVWSPIVIPFQRYGFVRQLNKSLLRAGLWVCRKLVGLKNDMLWTYNPMTCKFIETNTYGVTVYHCVDEIKAQPGMPAGEIEKAEKELTSVADVCFATSQHLYETRKVWNRNTHYFPNVADFPHFHKAMDEDLPIPADLACFQGPRIGFIGAISSYKVDFVLLKKMAEAHPEWSIILIGKVGEGDPGTDVSDLDQYGSIHLIGPRGYGELPAYLKGFDVAILPSHINDYTQGMFPMKFFEYLAAGRPVVATQLPTLKDYGHVAALTPNYEGFITAVEDAVAGRGADIATRLDAAKEQTYERRTRKMMAIIDAIPNKVMKQR